MFGNHLLKGSLSQKNAADCIKKMTEIVEEFVFVRVKNLMNDQENERREDFLSEFLFVRVKRKRIRNMVNEDKIHCLRDWILLIILCHLGKIISVLESRQLVSFSGIAILFQSHYFLGRS